MATARQFSPEPLTLYAGTPTPGHIPSVVALAQAYVHFRAQYRLDDPEHRLILDGVARAFTGLQERPWTVLPDGTLELAGSTGDVTYHISDAMCRQKGRTRTDTRTGRVEPALCPSFQFAQRRHGGACYHIIARELLRLAQLIDNPQAPPAQHTAAHPNTPFVTLSGRLLGLACGIARLPEQPVTLIITDTILTLLVGDAAPRHTLRLTGDDGHGDARIRLTADAFADLWKANPHTQGRAPKALPIWIAPPKRVIPTWQREIAGAFPSAEVLVIRDHTDVDRWLARCAETAAPAVIAIISHSTKAATGLRWQPAVLERTITTREPDLSPPADLLPHLEPITQGRRKTVIAYRDTRTDAILMTTVERTTFACPDCQTTVTAVPRGKVVSDEDEDAAEPVTSLIYFTKKRRRCACCNAPL